MDAVWVFVHGKCAVLGMMVGCGASALESVLVAGGRVRPKGGASPMVQGMDHWWQLTFIFFQNGAENV